MPNISEELIARIWESLPPEAIQEFSGPEQDAVDWLLRETGAQSGVRV
jgi:hypothetical protein